MALRKLFSSAIQTVFREGPVVKEGAVRLWENTPSWARNLGVAGTLGVGGYYMWSRFADNDGPTSTKPIDHPPPTGPQTSHRQHPYYYPSHPYHPYCPPVKIDSKPGQNPETCKDDQVVPGAKIESKTDLIDQPGTSTETQKTSPGTTTDFDFEYKDYEYTIPTPSRLFKPPKRKDKPPKDEKPVKEPRSILKKRKDETKPKSDPDKRVHSEDQQSATEEQQTGGPGPSSSDKRAGK